jgi:hypothetical protein
MEERGKKDKATSRRPGLCGKPEIIGYAASE